MSRAHRPEAAANAFFKGQLERNLAAIQREHDFGGLRTPDAEARLTAPEPHVEEAFVSPDNADWLRETLGISREESIARLGSCALTEKKKGTLVRVTGPERSNGTRDVVLTVRMVARRAGRLARAYAWIMGRAPNTDVHLMAWYGTALPDEADQPRSFGEDALH